LAGHDKEQAYYFSIIFRQRNFLKASDFSAFLSGIFRIFLGFDFYYIFLPERQGIYKRLPRMAKVKSSLQYSGIA